VHQLFAFVLLNGVVILSTSMVAVSMGYRYLANLFGGGPQQQQRPQPPPGGGSFGVAESARPPPKDAQDALAPGRRRHARVAQGAKEVRRGGRVGGDGGGLVTATARGVCGARRRLAGPGGMRTDRRR